MKSIFFVSFIILLSFNYLSAQCTGSDVGGTVFVDIPANGSSANEYGVKDANEQGLAGALVTVIDANQVVQTTNSDTNGNWTVASPTFPVRVEFSWTQTWLKESPFSTGANSSVRIIESNDCAVNFGLSDPNDYAETATPNYVSNIRITGSSVGIGLSSLETVSYSETGLSSDFSETDGTQGTATPGITDAQLSEIGSVWGKAFQTSQQRMFLGSALWRHVGFADGKGAGDIYVVDYSNGSPGSVLGSFDLQGVVPANGGSVIDLGDVCRGGGCENNAGNTGIASDYELPANPQGFSADLDAFAKVGKVGYGALDYDGNTEKIWTVNLNQKAILEIDVSGNYSSLPGTTNQYLISSLANAPSCANGELRPWALTLHEGKGFLGCLCDGLSSQNTGDMDAYVLSFDLSNPGAGFTLEYSMGLDYDKDDNDWNAWVDTYPAASGTNQKRYEQPILSDIEFDELGHMYLAFIDRWGMQVGFNNYFPESGASADDEKGSSAGELLKICNNAGTYEIEGTGTCPVNYAVSGEFFNDNSGDGHADGSGGALALVQGSNQLLLQIVDPHPEGEIGQSYWNTQGANTMSTTNGSIENWYSNLYSGGDGEYNGKGLGMGDIELLTEAAPVEIGNLVWGDDNGNGIQDPSESGIQNIVVDLLDASNTLLAQATTDANGYYVFSNNPNGTSTASQIYNISGLIYGNPYSLRIADAEGGSQQGALAGKLLTQNDTGQGANANINDSDATLSGNNATIAVVAGDLPSIGSNNHSFDFGFKLLPSLSVDSAIPSTCDAVTNTYSLVVTLTYGSAPTGDVTITTDNGVSQTFTPSSQDGTETFTLVGLVSDGVAAIDVTATYVSDATVTDALVDAYDAPANCSSCPTARCLPITAVKK